MGILTPDFQPCGIGKHGADGSLQQNIVNTVFVLLGLNRLADPLKVHHLLELLLEHRRRRQVEENHEERENAVDHDERHQRKNEDVEPVVGKIDILSRKLVHQRTGREEHVQQIEYRQQQEQQARPFLAEIEIGDPLHVRREDQPDQNKKGQHAPVQGLDERKIKGIVEE